MVQYTGVLDHPGRLDDADETIWRQTDHMALLPCSELETRDRCVIGREAGASMGIHNVVNSLGQSVGPLAGGVL